MTWADGFDAVGPSIDLREPPIDGNNLPLDLILAPVHHENGHFELKLGERLLE